MQSRAGPRVDRFMQAARFEGSLLASLSELKAIEVQRVADERAAVRRAEELRIEELVAAEHRHRDELAAQARAAHDAQLAVEHARLEAEREARLRLEAAEAAEHARQMIALTEVRTAQELELRRAQVAKQRPTWMLVVTGFALLAAAVMVWFAMQSRGASDRAEQDRLAAQEAAARAKAGAEESRIALERIDRELTELSGKVNDAVVAVGKAQTKAETDAANRQLKKLQQQQYDLAQRAEKARLDAARAARIAPVVVDQDCTNNSVCRKVNK
jgi:hypothetical protein